MFTLFRAVVIIGLIFYFSPERDPGQPERPARDGDRITASVGRGISEARDTSNSLRDRILGSLGQEVIRTAVNNKAEVAGLRLGDQVFGHSSGPSSKSAMVESLRRDREPTDGGSTGQSVRCIYRCDEAE
jgi:hypothetical protein